jgi:hypothetical protein
VGAAMHWRKIMHNRVVVFCLTQEVSYANPS